MTDDFNKWWDEDDLTTEGNNFVDGTPAYWAWEGWCAGVKAEREACAKVCEGMEENNLLRRYEYRRAVLNCADAIRARGNT
jgi:hypothetical protein